MKRCPTCNRTFDEDWLAFCTDDGSTLIEMPSAPLSNDPPPTVFIPPAVNTNPPTPFDLPGSYNPPQPVAPAWRPPPPPAYQAQSKSLATASMILGILSVTIGWLCGGPLLAIAAIVLGAIAVSQTKKTPERVGGTQMAWTGVITGSVALVGIIIFYIFVIVAGNL